MDVRVAEVVGYERCVERCGHDHYAKVVAQGAPHVEGHSEGRVALERALVELVEDKKPDVGELRVGEKPARKQALRQDLEARVGPDLPL